MENYKNFSKEQKKEFWSDHFKLWEQSDLPQKRYCDTNGISYWSFKTWYSRLKLENTKRSKFIKVKAPKSNIFSESKIEISINGNLKISISENISEENLRKIFSSAGAL